MSAETAPRSAAGEATEMEAFYRRVLEWNPFASSAVSDAAGDEVDVASIHRREFDDLVAYADEVRRQRGHVGQVVWGEAGIGKSHLLARFYRWANAGRACCVFLHNIQPSPDRLPWYVLKCVVERLVRGRRREFHGTPLYGLVMRAVELGLSRFRRTPGPPSARDARECYRRLIDELLAGSANAGPDARSIYDVLFHFFLGAYRGRHGDGDETTAQLAVRWLEGDELERDEARQLELRCGEDREHPASLPGVQAAESVLAALAELAHLSDQPLALCFDQIDNLSPEQLAALVQFLHPLIDHARNLLVLSSGVQSKLLQAVEQGTILRAAWERIAQDERGVRLGRLTKSEARRVLEARLERFFEPFATLSEVKERVADDLLFPLGNGWFDRRTDGAVDFRPRDLVNWGRDRWRDLQREIRDRGGPEWLAAWPGAAPGEEGPPGPLAPAELAAKIDEQIARKLGQQIARRAQEPESLPADAGNLAGLVEALLRQCLAVDGYALLRIDLPAPARAGRLPTYHLSLCSQPGADGKAIHTGVTFVATANRTSAARTLGRMVGHDQPPHRVVLVSEERLPLLLGAKGEIHLAALEGRGAEAFHRIELTFQEYAELDALQAVVGEARTGDLEVDLPGGAVHRVTEEEAVASHHRQDRFRGHRLLRLLLE